MVSQERPFVPQLIQEIPNFQTWVLSCWKDGLKTLVKHIDMNNFRFFVDSFGWPMMQYKISLTSNIWSPIDALPIQLWKVNVDGSPKSQTRVPSPIPYCPIWG
jgi:hypothetical protein